MLVLLIIPILVILSYAFIKSLVDLSTFTTCNTLNREINSFPNCNRYMIRAHYKNFVMTMPISFTGLTDYNPPKYEVIEKCLGFNELDFKKADIKPQPWCYEAINKILNLIKESFSTDIGDSTSEIQYDLLLLAGSDLAEGFETPIINGTESDILNYSFSYDL